MEKRSTWIRVLSDGRLAIRGTVLAMLLLYGTAHAHIGDLVFPIYELPTSALPDLHDGTLEDWEAALIPSLDHRDFLTRVKYGVGGGDLPVDQTELAFAVFLAWHHASQRILVGVYRYDAYYQSRLPPEPPPAQVAFPEEEMCCWMWDRVELVIDGDHGGELCLAPGRPGAGPAQIERFKRVTTWCASSTKSSLRLRATGGFGGSA